MSSFKFYICNRYDAVFKLSPQHCAKYCVEKASKRFEFRTPDKSYKTVTVERS